MGQVINMLEAAHRLSAQKFRQVNKMMNKAFEFEENGVTHAADHLEEKIDLAMKQVARYDEFITRQKVADFE